MHYMIFGNIAVNFSQVVNIWSVENSVKAEFVSGDIQTLFTEESKEKAYSRMVDLIQTLNLLGGKEC